LPKSFANPKAYVTQSSFPKFCENRGSLLDILKNTPPPPRNKNQPGWEGGGHKGQNEINDECKLENSRRKGVRR
jgi:hypothetical protein